ncbi:protein RRP6-like 2 isoform X2 [Coffea eugenioides]|uniref:protein RRP6-like 2 isoform X2 n=1 Tax=Coffea eugenioides TaxID=49369 RepID=UPI000F60C07D|nr:protein RRP6-like 2 isoform X2 [Coffea eugenioides]
MEVEPSEEESSKTVANLLSDIAIKGPLPSSVAKLSGSSRGIPSEKDFHFYKNFNEFKTPIKEIDDKSKSLLERIGVSSQLWGKALEFPRNLDFDDLDAYDWLVNINDDVLEKLDASLDEFRVGRGEESGFQVVQGRKNRRGVTSGSEEAVRGVQVAVKPKPKVPFHIATIPRPQDEYKFIVNNSNQPFEHVWLQRSEDGSRFVHPLENHSFLDFVDRSTSNVTPVKPHPLESTPFMLVEDVKDLKKLAAKLKVADEFAVDLEHNQYRSFQGLTCLMQISTRSEDFVIDTLKLRIHVGPYLREAFKDPNKKKVMHGADRDIIWLQRDFGIYVCNLFDTGQASRVLKLERNSLEYLLHHFCGVTANKEYQNADWRLRPLPHEMLRYAREDTHYLLYIYDLMRMKLLSASSETEDVNPPFEEVYKRSYDVCMQLYEKELLTDRSYLHIYGLQGADLNAQQLAVVAGLCEWRDVVARAEDESTGYVLPNKTLIEIAKQMPLTTSKLKRSLKSKHPYIERNLGSVLSIIRHSMQNAAAFEVAAQQLKEQHVERQENKLVDPGCSTGGSTANSQAIHKSPGESGSINSAADSYTAAIPRAAACGASESSGEAGASVQVLKKPSRGFGALLGGSTKRKLHPDIKEDQKLEEIKSSVNLPFHAFPSSGELLQPAAQERAALVDTLHNGPVSNSSNLEDFILLGAGSDVESGDDGTEAVNVVVDNKEDNAVGSTMDMEEGEGEDTMSLSDLSSSFQKCLPSINRVRDGKLVEKPQECAGLLQFKPFDYEAAKKQVIFREDPSPKAEDSRSRHTKGDKKSQKEDGTRDLPQGRRRQAFPASGNRTATFR